MMSLKKSTINFIFEKLENSILFLVTSFITFICCDFIEDEYLHICINSKKYFSQNIARNIFYNSLVVKLLIDHIFNRL